MAKTVITGEIRKLTVGNTGRIFAVGSVIGKATISKIVENPNWLVEHGERQYLVFTTENEHEDLWNEVTGFPCIVEFDKNAKVSLG